MAHIVFVGAGIGGMSGAYELRGKLAKNQHNISLINDGRLFQFVPSNPWIAVGWRKRKQTSLDAGKYLAKKGIRFIPHALTHLDAEAGRLTLRDGSQISYDYLVITTGPKLNFAAVPGAGPDDGHTQSVCTIPHAEACHDDFLRLVADPGPVTVGALPGASCFGPAYEYAFILDTELKRRKMRDRVPITFVTPEPYIGHLGLGGVGDSKSLLESELRQRDIKWITNARTTGINRDAMVIEEISDIGELKKTHTLPFKHSMMIPPFTGVDAVAAVEKLCNPKGFVLVDQYQRNPAYPNIYSAGVCIAIPPVEETPVPVGTPKTGYMIESMMGAIIHNIVDSIAGREPSHTGTLAALCLADMGNTGAAFVAIPQIPPRNVSWFRKGRWVHWAKIAFEKYFLHKLKKGGSEPVYEKYVLKLMGIRRLKETA